MQENARTPHVTVAPPPSSCLEFEVFVEMLHMCCLVSRFDTYHSSRRGVLARCIDGAEHACLCTAVTVVVIKWRGLKNTYWLLTTEN